MFHKAVSVLVIIAAVGACPMPAAHGASTVGLKGIGGTLGWVNPETLDATYYGGIVADLGLLTNGLGWDAEITQWSASDEGSYYSYSISDLTLAAALRLFTGYQGHVRAFFGLGIGMHGVTIESTTKPYGDPAAETLTVSHTEWKSRVSFQVGMEIPFSRKMKGRIRVEYISEESPIPEQFRVQISVIHWVGL